MKRIKWGIKELIKMYSDKPSYFSKKRIESGVAFIGLQYGALHWIIIRVYTCSATDLLIWASIEATIAGYILNQIQKEKKCDS